MSDAVTLAEVELSGTGKPRSVPQLTGAAGWRPVLLTAAEAKVVRSMPVFPAARPPWQIERTRTDSHCSPSWPGWPLQVALRLSCVFGLPSRFSRETSPMADLCLGSSGSCGRSRHPLESAPGDLRKRDADHGVEDGEAADPRKRVEPRRFAQE